MNKMEMFLFKSGQFTVMLALDAWNVLLFELNRQDILFAKLSQSLRLRFVLFLTFPQPPIQTRDGISAENKF